MSVDHIETVRSFFKRWGVSYPEVRQSMVDSMGESGRWVAGPAIPPTIGGEQAAGLMDAFNGAYDMDTIQVEMLKIAQSGDVVWCERLDTILDSKGTALVSIPVVGVITLNDAGQFTDWTDYWDRAEFDKLTPKG